MHRLAILPRRAGIPALCRLVRYEKSSLLSKRAALELLGVTSPGADPDRQIVEAVRKVLGDSRRPGAEWLLTYARFSEDPAAAGGPWSKLVAAEESLLKTARNRPRRTSPSRCCDSRSPG